jgi:hypothetical protein
MHTRRIALPALLFLSACAGAVTGSQDAWISSVSLSATSLTIEEGQSTELVAHFIAGSGQVSPDLGAVTSDQPVTVQPAVTTTYTLSVVKAGRTASTSVTVAVTAPAVPGQTLIYGDALAAGWEDWSWVTHSLANAAPVSAGARSISVDFTPYSGVSFVLRAGVSTAGAANLEFDVNGGTTANPAITAVAQIDAVNGGPWGPAVAIQPYCAGGIPAGAFAHCKVPLSALQVSDKKFQRIALEEAGGKTLPRMYFDQIAITAPPAAAAAIAVSVSPHTLSLTTGATATFTATVAGTASGQSTAVTWSVQEAGGGTVSAAGVYTAPATAGTYHVVATSVADTSKKDTATVTVTPPAPIAVAVSPHTVSVQPGATTTFTATASGTTGSQSTAVTWSVQESGGGTVSAAGVYTAPAAAGTYHVVATSVADTSKADSATVSVGTFTLIPADRLTTWNPGIPGGVPARTAVCASVNASTYGNGAQDATAGIQAALNGCPVGQVVVLSAGDFKITSPLQIGKGIVLRGQGPAQTKLKMPVGTNANLITIGIQWPKFTQSTSLAGNAVKGTQSVALAANPGLAAGEIVLIDQLTNTAITEWSSKSPPGDVSRTWFTRPDRPVGQVMEIQSVSGNTITFTTPFHIDFQTAYTAQLARFAAFDNGPVAAVVKYAGVEDLYVSGGSGGQGNVWLSNAAYSWIKNVESDFQDGPSIAIDASFRCIVRDSYVHSTQTPAPGGGGYGFSFSWYSADNLLENNISWNMNKVMVMRASGGGNVIAYNYMEDGWINYTTGWVEVGLNASHMTCPHYELFEGNQSFNFDGDNTWGNSVYITVFRNHLTGKRRSAAPLALTDAQNMRAVGLMEGHRWYSFVGNVLGTANQNPSPSTGYVLDALFPWSDNPIGMWRLGYNPENWNAAPDMNVTGTVIREGNFDYATSLVHWSGSAQGIPASLYLSSKPAFFGANPWPWVDPTGTTRTATLPARARFDVLHP